MLSGTNSPLFDLDYDRQFQQRSPYISFKVDNFKDSRNGSQAKQTPLQNEGPEQAVGTPHNLLVSKMDLPQPQASKAEPNRVKGTDLYELKSNYRNLLNEKGKSSQEFREKAEFQKDVQRMDEQLKKQHRLTIILKKLELSPLKTIGLNKQPPDLTKSPKKLAEKCDSIRKPKPKKTLKASKQNLNQLEEGELREIVEYHEQKYINKIEQNKLYR